MVKTPEPAAGARRLKFYRWSDAKHAPRNKRKPVFFVNGRLVVRAAGGYASGMFSHIVIFWTNPGQPNAADALIAGAEQHLKPIPGVLVFHVGRMVTDGRPRVESSYQVALTTVFASRPAREQYRAHPGHERFKQEVYEPNCARCLVYDFE